MIYYVIYLDYTEYNQFEGSWDTAFRTFDAFEDADRFSKAINPEHLIAGPLIKATQ